MIINFQEYLKKKHGSQKKQLPNGIKWYYIGKLDKKLKEQIQLLLLFDDEVAPYEKYFKNSNEDIIGTTSRETEKLISDTGAELINNSHRLAKYISVDYLK